MASHWFTRSQWALPTEQHYKTLQTRANQVPGEYLRKEYEELRKEYEELRRPFRVSTTGTWSDVWEFPPVQAYPGKHPCEKPLPLLLQALEASTRPGDLVFDPFAGSGSMAHACLDAGRRFIGTELCPDNYRKACARLESVHNQGRLFG